MRNLMTYLGLIGAATFVLAAVPANADDASRNKEIQERFAQCDVNRDGKLTLDEAKGCMPRIYDHFSMIDSQNKGYVTVAEIEAIANR
ncbi:EF-hand domain-containing protein [Polynucleobacter sp. 80A-SIGWE]|uniref:EF-hand domain-containing protein n=1 Tax=Polynucleobacter sp. 80A-SIGWE TaxID=2689100 RepID=UPI001C20F2D4|nr:EF-hand domain-containing protein [Polynucleobacter sp. 80A-SIGWE]MBU3590244.1 EF-hand domain-containing protein [Polynucleobacter sp. 80A-SIGWE]